MKIPADRERDREWVPYCFHKGELNNPLILPESSEMLSCMPSERHFGIWAPAHKYLPIMLIKRFTHNAIIFLMAGVFCSSIWFREEWAQTRDVRCERCKRDRYQWLRFTFAWWVFVYLFSFVCVHACVQSSKVSWFIRSTLNKYGAKFRLQSNAV